MSLRKESEAQQPKASPDDQIKGAITAVQENRDSIVPARSTLPPDLELPEREEGQSKPGHWWKIGMTYGRFYKDGVKAVYHNWTAENLVKQRKGADVLMPTAIMKKTITRAEYQLMERSRHDKKKLLPFGLLAVVFGEWLILLVPLIPNVFPLTCRAPSQTAKQRQQLEQRRGRVFRRGIPEPERKALLAARDPRPGEPAPQGNFCIAGDPLYTRRLVDTLSDDQLMHLSTTLNLHSSIWDYLAVPPNIPHSPQTAWYISNWPMLPPPITLKRRIAKRLTYLAMDDLAFLANVDRDLGKSLARLPAEELRIACSERGMDVLGRSEQEMLRDVEGWLRMQNKDRGMGKAMMVMLFRRQRAWETRAGLMAKG